jgi:hypothetical protein
LRVLTPDEDVILNEIKDNYNFELSSVWIALMANNVNMTYEMVVNAFLSLYNKGLIAIPDMLQENQ